MLRSNEKAPDANIPEGYGALPDHRHHSSGKRFENYFVDWQAGPEHIKLMNGRAVVTPLSGKAKNTPAGGGIGQQTNNFYNYKPRDGEKVARDLNRRLGISVRPVRV